MTLRLDGVSLRVRGRDHLHPLDLDVAPAGTTVLFGPALAGKTSLLRLMAGLVTPTRGRVVVDGQDVTGVPVRRRKVAMVYRQFINYPSMTVFDNIAAPLRLQQAAGIEQTVTAVAKRLRIDHLLERLPGQLPGEQQQRVALARALAKDAPLILLDEPLASLDRERREEMRAELTRLFAGGTAAVVHATAEPAEALLMGGHTAVIDDGRLLQYGRTIDVFLRPATVTVARAFSDPPINLVPGRLQRNALQIEQGPRIALHAVLDTEQPEVTVGIRPCDLRIQGGAGDVHFDARVESAELTGSDSVVHVASRLGPLVAQAVGVHRFEPGQNLRLHVDPGAVYLFDHAGALLLAPEGVQAREQHEARVLARASAAGATTAGLAGGMAGGMAAGARDGAH